MTDKELTEKFKKFSLYKNLQGASIAGFLITAIVCCVTLIALSINTLYLISVLGGFATVGLLIFFGVLSILSSALTYYAPCALSDKKARLRGEITEGIKQNFGNNSFQMCTWLHMTGRSSQAESIERSLIEYTPTRFKENKTPSFLES